MTVSATLQCVHLASYQGLPPTFAICSLGTRGSQILNDLLVNNDLTVGGRGFGVRLVPLSQENELWKARLQRCCNRLSSSA
jgi:hypothetical protein